MKLRKEVKGFAVSMERELRRNDWKPGWKSDEPVQLLERLEDEVYEVRKALESSPENFSEDAIVARLNNIRKECADVGNFAMMISDVTADAVEGVIKNRLAREARTS